MTKNKRIIRTLALALTLLLSVNYANATVVTDYDDIIAPLYAQTDSMSAVLKMGQNGNVTATGIITGKIRTTKIVLNMYLQKYSTSESAWKNVTKWSATKSSNQITLTKTYKLTSKGKYRVKLKATVTSPTGSEDVAVVSTTKTYS